MSRSPFRPLFVPRSAHDPARVLTLLDAVDGTRFHEAVRPVARTVDDRMARGVLADRLSASPLSAHGHDWLLPWRPALGRFRRLAAAFARERPVLVRTDVRDCFGAIGPDQVEPALAALGAHPAAVGSACGVLEALAEAGVRGLPVGPAASSVLANAVLAVADRALGDHPFLRWVDDLFVFVEHELQGQRVLARVRSALDEMGLTLADDKTVIGPPAMVAGATPSGVAIGPTALQSLPT